MKKKKSIFRETAAVLAAIFLAVSAGCAPASRTDEKIDLAAPSPELKDAREEASFNKTESLSNHFILPPSWDSRSSAPNRLVGHYLALVPDRKSPTGHRVKLLGSVLSAQGNRALSPKKVEGTRYQGLVEGGFAKKLSFVQGRFEPEEKSLYEITVTDERAFMVPARNEFLDTAKVRKLRAKLPQRYRDVFFVSSAAGSTITARQYDPSAEGLSKVAAAARVGETYFFEKGEPVARQALYLTLLSDGALFGNFDPKSGLYNRKKDAGKISLKKGGKRGALVSFQTAELLRKTLATQGLPAPE